MKPNPSLLAGIFLCSVAAVWAADTPTKAKVVVPFDFVSQFDGGRYGQKLGDAIWRGLAGQKQFVIPESMVNVRDYCSEHGFQPTPQTDLAAIGKVVHLGFDAQIAIWGSIERAKDTAGDVYDLKIKCYDFSASPPQKIYDVSVQTKTVSEVPHVYVKELFDALLQSDAVKNPTVQSGTPAAKRLNLIIGDFEQGRDGVPTGWENVAGQQREPLGSLVQWTTEQGNPKNRVIRFTLDRNVAENEGVMYYSDYFPVEEGAKYRFQCRWRSDSPAVKVFIKCYDQVSESATRREVYRNQQNLKGPLNQWNQQIEEFTPRHTKYSPQWGRVMLYAYLKPGTVEFDDVTVEKVAEPSPDERAKKIRRPSSQSTVTSEQIEGDRRPRDK